MTVDDKKLKNEMGGFITEQIEFQLDSITRSSIFKTSIQMQNFLRYIVHKKLLGQEQLLKQYTIAVEALGQEEDFDPEANPLIRIEAGRLRKKLTEYYAEIGKNDFCVISMPVGRYVPKFEKNENAQAETDDDIKQEVKSESTTIDGWKQSCGPRLLVSCFTDHIQNGEGTRLLHYIADNLAFILSRFLLFRLMSSIPNVDKEISTAVIKSYQDSKHKADYILSVNIHDLKDDAYQLVARLIVADTDEVLWSDSYSLQVNSAVKNQQDICNKITATVADLLQGVMHVHWARQLLQNDKKNIDERYRVLAYYRHYSDHLTDESFRTAVQVCQHAIEKDAEDVIAHIVYCEYCRQEHVYARGVIKNPLEKGLKSGQEATRLRPDSHEAHYVLGQMWFHLGFEKLCIIAFEQSRRLSHHNPQITFGYGFHLFFMERWDEAMRYVNQVLESKLSYPDWYHTLPFLNYYRLGQYDEALIEAQQITSPGVFWGPLSRAVVYGQLNQLALAKSECDELFTRYPDFKKNGLKMLKNYLSSTLLFDQVYDGLKKAGIEFKDI